MITVEELISLLSRMDQDARVCISYPIENFLGETEIKEKYVEFVRSNTAENIVTLSQ